MELPPFNDRQTLGRCATEHRPGDGASKPGQPSLRGRVGKWLLDRLKLVTTKICDLL